MNVYERKVNELLEKAGVTVGGPNHFDIHVNDNHFYEMVAKQRILGAGDSYVKGYWDVEDLKTLSEKILLAENDIFSRSFTDKLSYAVFNAQNKVASIMNVKDHYDIGYLVYESMLDERMVYSCAYWNNIPYSPANLELAQVQKLEMICRKLGLHKQPRGQRILDVGCGNGGFAKYAHENYGAHVVGITLSRLQYTVAKRVCAGLPIEIRFQDYRDIPEGEMYDHIVSVGMVEHVGSKNYRTFIRCMKKHLKNEEHGENVFLLHTIFTHNSDTRINAWMDREIFPGAEIPSEVMLMKMIQDLFVCEDFHTFGPDYSLTTDAWWDRYKMNPPYPLKKYGKEFHRTWEFYLKPSSASFLVRKNDLVQMVLTHNGTFGGRKEVREIFPKR